MGNTLENVQALIGAEDWRLSDHAMQRIEEFAIIVSDLIEGISKGEMVEDYPDYYAGPCVLMLQSDRSGPVHTLWGMKSGTVRPAVLVTAYRPSLKLWEPDYRTRK